MLYEVLRTAKMGAGKAPDLYTALLAKNLRRDGEVKTLSGIPPLTFTSNGQSLLDYLISGNTVQSGTPTPDSPIMPQGTGERTGNLFDISSITHQTLGTDGSLTYESAMDLSGFIKVNGNYTVSWKAEKSGAYMRVSTFDDNKNFIERVTATNTYTNTHYSNSHSGYIRINYENSKGLSEVMLNTGSTAKPYEPYGYKIPISSASTTTNIYLGEVQSTRRVKKYEFTGNETFSVSNTDSKTRIGYAGFVNEITASSLTLCSHYKYKYASNIFPDVDCFMFSSDKYMWIGVVYGTTVSDFKSYLAAQYAAGTPVTVWYVLATPETAVVNEPLMRIGDYTDSISMEQTGIEIPTTRGTNTLDVLTDVKPSEIYIKYKE